MTPHRDDTTAIAAAVQRGVQQLRETHAVERQRFTELQETLQRVALAVRLPPSCFEPRSERRELTRLPPGEEFHLCVTGDVYLHHMLCEPRYATMGLLWWDTNGWHTSGTVGDCDTAVSHLLGTPTGAEAIERARSRLAFDVGSAGRTRDRRLKRSRRFGAAAVIVAACTAVLGLIVTVEVVVALLVVCGLLAGLSALFHDDAQYPNTIVERYSKWL